MVARLSNPVPAPPPNRLKTGRLNGVTIGDALAIQQHLTNINPIADAYKMIAADVNRSNSIISADQSGLDFYGVKVGDVTAGHADPATFGGGGSLVLRVQDQPLQAGAGGNGGCSGRAVCRPCCLAVRHCVRPRAAAPGQRGSARRPAVFPAFFAPMRGESDWPGARPRAWRWPKWRPFFDCTSPRWNRAPC
ncbi:MAG: hypothetical protein IPH12_21505 [Saprospirales bacterium]|nr:hypothetical protein [Saprospirales bacterium]MBK8920587.1 hypothetical protein [Saprospirales bacterium]